MNNNYTKIKAANNSNPRLSTGYVSDSVRSSNNHVINGFFPKSSVKAMAIKKVNNTLCGMLLCVIIISLISYFFVVISEIRLNECSRKTMLLNVENAELENKLDKLKSFNNVDLTMQKNNLLQRPEKVIEATEVSTGLTQTKKTTTSSKPKAWAIGY